MNEVPHSGFDKPEKYETFTTTNDLEEAAEEHLNIMFGKGKHQPLYKELFKAGAEWQKEQILNWAKDKEVIDILNKRIAAKDKWAEGYLVAMEDLVDDIKNKLI